MTVHRSWCAALSSITRRLTSSSGGNARQIAFTHQREVMPLVPGNEVQQRSHGRGSAAEVSRASGELVGQSIDEPNRGRANADEFVQNGLHRSLLELSGGYVRVLIEPRQRRLVAARDVQRTIAEDSLAI